MKTYNIILFDLDGTLTDSKPGIINSIQYALSKFGIKEEVEERLLKFIGPPLKDSFKKYYAFDDLSSQKAVQYYREYFSETGIFENSLYDGISELLPELKAAGKKIILATSKPTVFAERILQHFNISHYFDLVAGAALDGTRLSKHEVIGYVLTDAGATLLSDGKENVVMVGDRADDILGAQKHGLDSIAVGYGYGTEEELRECKPTFIAKTIDDLRKIFLQKE